MKLTYRHLADGPGPSEVIIEIRTIDGIEEVIVDRSILKNNLLEVGGAITRRDGNTLVELPRESVSGRTRVWVPHETARESTAA